MILIKMSKVHRLRNTGLNLASPHKQYFCSLLSNTVFLNLLGFKSSSCKSISSPGKKASKSWYRDASRRLRNTGLTHSISSIQAEPSDNEEPTLSIHCLYQMWPLNHKRTTSSLAPPIFYVAKKYAIKRQKVPH